MDRSCSGVGQTVDPGNVSYSFPQQLLASSPSQNQYQYIGSGFSQNQIIPECQRVQNSGNPYRMNQQAPPCGQNLNFGQPMQQDQFGYNNQQQPQNCYPQNLQSVPLNPCLCPLGAGQYLPQNIVDQIRTCVGNTATPIFILPNSQPIQPQPQFPQLPQNPTNIGYPPPIGNGYPLIGSNPIMSPPCYQFPMAMIPICNSPFVNQSRSNSEKNSTLCDCNCRRNDGIGNNSLPFKNSGTLASNGERNEAHRCCPGSDDTVCTKPNCPASINLQALASQLLSIQGVIPCAGTRLILRKIPGSSVTTTVEATMERAQKSICSLNKEQLIIEARNAQQVNGLINLHMMANPPQNIIPILTMLQLKINSLKALVENLVNKSISECQSIGAEGNTKLEPMLLTIKSDAEIRELLAILRQKECEERVNVNYAPYHSQKVVAESRLANFQNKINQVETEIERRRSVAMPWATLPTGQGNYRSSYFQETQCNGVNAFNPIFDPQNLIETGFKAYESPSPFIVPVQGPKRLNLKPNVGGPSTTYEKSALPDEDVKRCCKNENSGCNEKPEDLPPSKEVDDFDKASIEGKKKLKIHVDDKGEFSVKKKSLEEFGVGEFVQLSPDVVIVINEKNSKVVDDKNGGGINQKEFEHRKQKIKKNYEIKNSDKSAESIPTDSSDFPGSESSLSSRSSGAEANKEKDQNNSVELDKKRSKSILKKNVSKGRKKTTKNKIGIKETIADRDISSAPSSDDPEIRSIKK